MTFATAIAGDFVAVADGLEAVTLKYPGAATTTAVASALRRAISIREVIASSGRYTKSDLVWHFPVSAVATQPPIGSKIVDSASVYWTVLDIAKQTLTNRWRAVTCRVRVPPGPQVELTVQESNAAHGQHGAAELQWHDLATVIGWIEDVASDLTSLHDRKASIARFQVTLSEDVEIDPATCRIVGPDGQVYLITQSRGSALDSLQTLDVIQQPTPEAG